MEDGLVPLEVMDSAGIHARPSQIRIAINQSQASIGDGARPSGRRCKGFQVERQLRGLDTAISPWRS